MSGDPRRLEKVHGPVLEVFPALRRRGDAGRFELSPERVAAFGRDGFTGGLPVLDRAAVDELRSRVDHLRRHLRRYAPRLYEVERAHLERPDEVVVHFLGGWLIDPWLHDLVFAPALTVPAAQLLGLRRLRLWHDQVFYKPAGHPGHVPWHQDYSYWTRAAPARHVTLHVALDDADEESGCVQMVPGSHRWELLPVVPFDAPMDALLGELPPPRRAAFAPVPVRLRAGEASVHHSHTVHGSTANRSRRPRRSLVVNYMAPDTRVASADAPLLEHVPPMPVGALIEGDHFPIVLDLEALEP